MTEIKTREWWSQRWIDLLETYRFKKRLERARNYARLGNILSIEFQSYQVLAQVQGTDPEPYNLSIWLEHFTEEQWQYVIETLSEKAIYSAQLLAGKMPSDIEDVFARNGLSLYPFQLLEVSSKCSCPDPENPCKHIGAVYYLLGDRFSEDPFILFQLRGKSKEDILQELREFRRAKLTDLLSESTQENSDNSQENMAENTIDISKYYDYNEPLESSLVVITPSSETVLDILGKIPLTSDNYNTQSVMQYLDNIYKTVSQQAFLTGMK